MRSIILFINKIFFRPFILLMSIIILFININVLYVDSSFKLMASDTNSNDDNNSKSLTSTNSSSSNNLIDIKDIFYNDDATLDITENDFQDYLNNTSNETNVEKLKKAFQNALKNADNIKLFSDISFSKSDNDNIKLISKPDSQIVKGEFTIKRKDPSYQETTKPPFLKNVCGYEDVKKELKHIADYITNKEQYDKIGAELPKGYILHGPPGTGKTYFAKQLSEELNIPFNYYAGPEFEEKYIGEGNKKAKKIFDDAVAMNKPCIIFIDEIDAILSKRGSGDGEGTRAHNSLVNQFLVELDGFKTRKHPIIVIGATNKVDLLDPAATRPGRLEKKILIDLPNQEDCLKILNMYLKKITLDPSLQQNDYIKKSFLTKIADECFHAKFSAAQFKRLANDSAILAVSKNKHTVDEDIIRETLNKIENELEQKISRPVDLSHSTQSVFSFSQIMALSFGIIFLILGIISLFISIYKKYQKNQILKNL